MEQARVLNKYFFLALSLASLTFFNVQAKAQTQPPAPADQQQKQAKETLTPAEIPAADVLILANVTASELKFEVVPDVKVEFPGTKERKTVWESDRQNLPRPVEPGVTYRNIGIQLRIASRFADIERIVSEALGETPARDEKAPAEEAPSAKTEKPAQPVADKNPNPARPRSN